MPDPNQPSRSDALLEALDALKRTEAQRHRAPNRSPLFRALADEADAHRRRIFRIATEPEPEPARRTVPPDDTPDGPPDP